MRRPNAIEEDKRQHPSKAVDIEERMSVVFLSRHFCSNVSVLFGNLVVVNVKTTSSKH